MPLSPSEVSIISTHAASRLAGGRLNDWQREFLSGISARIARDGTKATLSPKQIQTLNGLLGTAVKGDIASPNANPTNTPSPYRRRRASFLRRELRWFGRRIVRDAILALLLVAASTVVWIGDGLEEVMPTLPLPSWRRTSRWVPACAELSCRRRRHDPDRWREGGNTPCRLQHA